MYGIEFDKDGAAVTLQEPDDLKKVIEVEENTFDPAFYAYDRSVHSVLVETIYEACK